MRNFPILGTCLLLVLAAPLPAGADDLLVGWDFAGNGGGEAVVTAKTVSACFVPTTIRRGPGGPAAKAETNAFWSTSWPAGYSGNYLEFSITPKPQYWFSPTSILVQTWLPLFSPEMYWRLYSDRDGYAGILAEWYCSNWTFSPTNFPRTVVLPADFKDIRTTVVFRLYGHAGTTGPDGGLGAPGLDLAVYGSAHYGESLYNGALLTWDFTGKAGDEATVAATARQSNLLDSVVSRGPGLTAVARTNSFNSQNWNSYLSDDYVEFPVSLKPGYACAVTGMSISTYGGTYGGINWHLRSDRDGYADDLDTWYQVDGATAWVHQASVSASSLANMTTSAVFRLYGQNWSGGPDVALQDFSNNPALIVSGQLWFDDAGDVDNDGMPNVWERIGTGTATGAVNGADFDRDGVPDDQEWIADTNPGNSNDFLAVRRIAISSPPTMTISSSVDRIYTLQKNDQIVTGAWNDVSGQTNVPGIGGQLSLTDTNAIPSKRNYRVEAAIP